MVKPSEVGKRIKRSRSLKNMTLRDVANKAGVSATLISDIERGKTSPTIKSLTKISHALDETIVHFIEDRKSREVTHSSVDDRVTVVNEKINARHTSLTKKIANGRLEVLEARYENGAKSRKPLSHFGEKIAILVEGKLEVTIEDRVYKLSSGDTLYFNSELPHVVSNPAEEPARVLWVITPISRSPVI